MQFTYFLKRNIKYSLYIFVCFSASSLCFEFAPPRYQLVDNFGVNLATGQVTHSLNTVSIGGEKGLTHNISLFTNAFKGKYDQGYWDSYRGGAKLELLANNQQVGVDHYRVLYILRVHDKHSSADFYIMVNGEIETVPTNELVDNYSYQATGDSRDTLTVDSANKNLMTWTKPDGTIVKLKRDVFNSANSSAWVTETIYPNGFTVYVDAPLAPNSVSTNTGFQLKYEYINDTRPYVKDEAAAGIVSGNNLPEADSEAWSERNPKTIRAINAAVEFCSADKYVLCNELSHNWSAAEFEWPAGMPRAFYVGDNIFSVTDSLGGRTEFHYRSYDRIFDEFGNKLIDSVNTPEGTLFASRLRGVKSKHSQVLDYSYVYRNIVRSQSFGVWGVWNYVVPHEEMGELQSASTPNGYMHYRMNAPKFGAGGPLENSGGTSGGVTAVLGDTVWPGTLGVIYTTKGNISLDNSFANKPFFMRQANGPDIRYYYTRDNLTRITRGDHVMEAEYPESCTEDTRKICNQPIWKTDFNGNRTDFTYHALSGQVESITLPENANGIRPQTRYTYEPKFASYYHSDGVKRTATRPVYMKMTEKFCRESEYIESSCKDNDETVIAYEYNHDNLLLTGMTITADGKKLRTCYQYDIYGNKIGEIQANANMTSCN